MQKQQIRIFLSSPGDVGAERNRVSRVVDRLNAHFFDTIELTVIRWESTYYTADSGFQAQIDDPGDCDLVVSIFWSRIGTELPPSFETMSDGKPYPSGTVYEIAKALEARQTKGVPDVLAYRKTKDMLFPVSDLEKRKSAEDQLSALQSFWEEWFRTREGHFTAGFQSFVETDEFEDLFEQHLRQWLGRKELLGREVKWRLAEKGSPFRSLLPFEARHETVFFGRDVEIRGGIEKLRRAAENAMPFLLLIGGSGSGKSSLARAGIIPQLTRPGGDNIEYWRTAGMMPGKSPMAALSSALFDEACLKAELQLGDFGTPEALERHFKNSADPAPLLSALARAEIAMQQDDQFTSPPRTDLLLLIDQGEQLFGASDDDAAAFTNVLLALAKTQRVWIIMTMRDDSYPALSRDPNLRVMREKGASLDIAPPGAVEIAEIIRKPAIAAGLRYEVDAESGRGLDDMLIDDIGESDALPLIEFTLSQLFECLAARLEATGATFATATRDDLVLKIEDYVALGRLEGSIGRSADNAFSKLSQAAQASLPRVLRTLARFSTESGKLLAVQIPISQAAPDDASRALIDALTAAHVIILSAGKAEAEVRLAHEAVLRTWPAAQAVVEEDQRFFQIREEIKIDESRYRAGKNADGGGWRSRNGLLHGLALANARAIRQKYAADLSPELLAFIDASIGRANLRTRVAASLGALFLGAIGFAVYQAFAIMDANRIAELEKRRSEAASLAVEAQHLINQEDLTNALFQSRKAFQTFPTVQTRSTYLQSLIQTSPYLTHYSNLAARTPVKLTWLPDGRRLLAGTQKGSLVLVDPGRKDGEKPTAALPKRTVGSDQMDALDTVREMRWAADGNLYAMSENGNVSRVKVADGLSVSQSKQLPIRDISAAVISPDGKSLLAGTWSKPGAILIDCRGGEADIVSGDCPRRVIGTEDSGYVSSIAMRPDGSAYAIAFDDGTVKILDASAKELSAIQLPASDKAGVEESRAATLTWQPGKPVLAVGTTDGRLLFFDLGGALIRQAEPTTGSVAALAFDPKGGQLAAVCNVKQICLYEFVQPRKSSRSAASPETSGEEIALLRKSKLLAGHLDQISALSWSGDGRLLASAAADRSIRIWDSARLDPVSATLTTRREQFLFEPSVSPDGKLLAAGSESGDIFIWRLADGRRLATLGGVHKGFVRSIDWHPSENRLVSADSKGGLALWRWPDRQPVSKQVVEGAEFWKVRWLAGGMNIAMAAGDGYLRLWSLDTNQVRKLGGQDEQAVIGLAPGATHDQLLSGYSGGKAQLWNIEGGDPIVLPVPQDLKGKILTRGSIDLSADGRMAATAGNDGNIILYDMKSRQVKHVFRLSLGGSEPVPVEDIEFNADASLLAAITSDGWLRLWNTANFTPRLSVRLYSFTERQSHLQELTWLKDRNALAVTSAVGEVKIISLDEKAWDRRANQVLQLGQK